MFTTTPDSGDGNSNGLPDDQEVAAGTTSDLDADGNDDLSQADMHCVALADGSGWTCLKDTEASAVEEFYSIDSDVITDTDGRPDNLPFGLFGFRLAVAPRRLGDGEQILFDRPARECLLVQSMTASAAGSIIRAM